MEEEITHHAHTYVRACKLDPTVRGEVRKEWWVKNDLIIYACAWCSSSTLLMAYLPLYFNTRKNCCEWLWHTCNNLVQYIFNKQICIRNMSSLNSNCNAAHLVEYLFQNIPSCTTAYNCNNCGHSYSRASPICNINVDVILKNGIK